MIIDARIFNSPQTLDADVCILGAGVAGIVLAHELINSGLSVVLLEAGGLEYDPGIQDLYRAQKIPKYFTKMTKSRLRMLGGSSNHWENSTERFDPIDFEQRDWVEHSGWPLGFEEINRFYPQAEQYCGVGSDGYSVTPWLENQEFTNICSGSELIAPAIIKIALPPTRFFQKYKHKIENSKDINIIHHASVSDLHYDVDSQTVKSAFFHHPGKQLHQINAKLFVLSMGGIENPRLLLKVNQKYQQAIGNKYDLVGRFFMEHPVIRAAQFYPLKNQKLPKGYSGVVDATDALRLIRLRLKLTEKALYNNQTNNLRLFMVAKSERILSPGISSSHIIADQLKEGEWPENFGLHIANVLEDIDLVADAVYRKVFDSSLFSDADEFGGYQILAMMEQTPDPENRLILGDEIDSLGLPKVVLKWKVSELDKSLAWKSLGILAKDSHLNRIGRIKLLTQRQSRIWGDQLGLSNHHMGTTKMGSSERNGVVDPQCKVYGTTNLFVSGSSVFPTGGHVPPTLTITAMAIRLAGEIKKRLV